MMTPVWAIVKKDLRNFLTSPMFYALLGMCCCLWGIFFSFQVLAFTQNSYQSATQGNVPGMNIHQNLISSYIVVVHYVLIFIIAAMSLRFFAEEKKLKTFPILLTSPLTSWQIVLAKWIVGALLVFGLLFVSALYPLSLLFFIEIPMATFFLCYFGVFILLCVYMSASLLASAVTDSMIVCVVLSLMLSIALLLLGIGREFTDSVAIQEFFNFLTIDRHFSFFRTGVFNLSSTFYFLSGSLLFILITERVIEFHRWR